MAPEILQLRRQGRSARTALVLLAIYAALAAALVWLDAAPWLVTALALPTLPALWELWRNPVSTLELDSRRLSWNSGRQAVSLDLDDIAQVRFDTRWDLSVRVGVRLRNDRLIRVPPQCLPPHRRFEAALQARGVAVERHHFRVF